MNLGRRHWAKQTLVDIVSILTKESVKDGQIKVKIFSKPILEKKKLIFFFELVVDNIEDTKNNHI